jgi:uncharacterized protein (TIGR02246 family)
MFQNALLVGLAVVLWAGAAAGQQAPVSVSACKATDDSAIRELASEFDAAWTAKSASRYAATFSEDADWENAFGGRRQGRKAIEEITTNLLRNNFGSVHETMTAIRILCIEPDVALGDLYQTITGQTGGAGNVLPDRHIRMSQVYVKRHGHWQIRVHRVADLRGFQNGR